MSRHKPPTSNESSNKQEDRTTALEWIAAKVIGFVWGIGVGLECILFYWIYCLGRMEVFNFAIDHHLACMVVS